MKNLNVVLLKESVTRGFFINGFQEKTKADNSFIIIVSENKIEESEIFDEIKSVMDVTELETYSKKRFGFATPYDEYEGQKNYSYSILDYKKLDDVIIANVLADVKPDEFPEQLNPKLPIQTIGISSKQKKLLFN